MLHLLKSRDDTLNVINVNSFYARNAQETKVKTCSRPLPGIRNRSQLPPTTKTTPSSSSATCHSSKNDKNPLIIYTDGACQGNGTEDARAGVGVYYGKKDPRNISTSLQGKRQTNNRAELTAIKLALEGILNIHGKSACDTVWTTTKINKTTASATTRKKKIITIKSDSEYCQKGLKIHLPKWKHKGWLNSKNEPVANQDLWQQVDKLNTKIKHLNGIVFDIEWVKGHNGDEGNEAADKLAVAGISKGRTDKSTDT